MKCTPLRPVCAFVVLSLPVLMIVVVVYYSISNELGRRSAEDNKALLPLNGDCDYDAHEDRITCEGQGLNESALNEIFLKLSNDLKTFRISEHKHFKCLWISNTSIHTLNANTFADIVFDEIIIIKNELLSSIHRLAFRGTDRVTKALVIGYNPALTQTADNTLFECLSQFVNIERIYLIDNNVTEIPDKAFNGRRAQNMLTRVELRGRSIARIGQNVFTMLKHVTDIVISDTSITHIPYNAFAFDEPSNRTLTLTLDPRLLLNSTGFDETCLSNTNRPTTVVIDSHGVFHTTDIPYIPENIFSFFLMANAMNVIDTTGLRINCNDCRNLWLKSYPKLIERQRNHRIECSDGEHLDFNSTGMKRCASADENNGALCPDEGLIAPCVCNEDTDMIMCGGGGTELDLESIFQRLSAGIDDDRKHFKTLRIRKSSVGALNASTFRDVVFDEIIVSHNDNLRLIHWNAFSGTASVTKALRISNNRRLISVGPDHDIHSLCNAFANIESIILYNNNITKIPVHAFDGAQGSKSLQRLYFGGTNINTMGARAFYMLNNLTEVIIAHTNISHIPESAFAFSEHSNHTFTVGLNGNSLINSTSFDPKCLSDVRRPMKIWMNDMSVRYLPERVFAPFLLGANNAIVLNDVHFGCSDCRNGWTKSFEKSITRNRIECIDGDDPGAHGCNNTGVSK